MIPAPYSYHPLKRTRGATLRHALEITQAQTRKKAPPGTTGPLLAFCEHAGRQTGVPQLDVDRLKTKLRRLEAKIELVEKMGKEKLPLVQWELFVEPLYESYDQAHWRE